MGWMYGWESRKELVEHLIQPWDAGDGTKYTHLKKYLSGNDMWAVVEKQELFKPAFRFIMLYMLRKGGRDGWGYKDVGESMGPRQLTCPLSYLDLASEPSNQYATEWRERVRRHHAGKH